MLTKAVGRAEALETIEHFENSNLVGLEHLTAVVRHISHAHDMIDRGIDVEYYTGVSERLTEHFDALEDDDYAQGYYYYIKQLHQ